MQNQTIRELKSLAIELGLKGYINLRKAKLIQMIGKHQQRISSNILDEPVPEINVPILEPAQFSARNRVASLKSLAGKIFKPVIGKINKFADWIMSYTVFQSWFKIL